MAYTQREAELTQIIASLQEFFAAQETRRGQQQCPHCGAALQYLDGTFWLNGTEHEWNVSLPFCPTCDPQLCEIPSPLVQ
jgi:phage terminase large subunit GpA-like protein